MELGEFTLFQSLASIWYSKALTPLSVMNDLRIPAIVEGLESVGAIKLEHLGSDKPLKGLTILDVGCGGGFASEPLEKLGAEVVGIDGVPELIEVAKGHAAEDKTITNLTYIASTMEEFALKCERQFDVVLVFEVLDHMFKHREFLDAAAKCLKPGGSMFLSTMQKCWAGWFYCKILPEYVFRWIPAGAHHYNKFISSAEVENMLRPHNFETKTLKGMYYNFWRQYWYWVEKTNSWYFLHTVKKKKNKTEDLATTLG